MERRLLTTTEVAAKLRAPVDTVRYWRHIGSGPPGARIGRRVLYDEAEVERWLEEQFRAAQPPTAAA